MAVSDLQAKQGKVDIILEVTDKSEPREFQKFGKPGKVCNAKAKDATGEITLTLWNEQADMVKVGDKVHVKNGYVSEWQGELQLSTGKFGELEVVSGDSAAATEPSVPQGEAEEEEPAEEKPSEPAPEMGVEEEEVK